MTPKVSKYTKLKLKYAKSEKEISRERKRGRGRARLQAEMKVSSDGTLRERSAKDMTAAAKYPLAGALDLVPRYLGDMCI